MAFPYLDPNTDPIQVVFCARERGRDAHLTASGRAEAHNADLIPFSFTSSDVEGPTGIAVARSTASLGVDADHPLSHQSPVVLVADSIGYDRNVLCHSQHGGDAIGSITRPAP